jgi:cobalt-zinc-cadmium resistance protein CzcA
VPAAAVGRPIAFATLIVVAVFLPLFGIEGHMHQPSAAAVIAAMASSLLLALTPLASALLLRRRPPGRPEDVWLVRRRKGVYAPLLDGCMRQVIRRLGVGTSRLRAPGCASVLGAARVDPAASPSKILAGLSVLR